MRIIQLTPGTGHFYCGSCLRDNALASALRRRGHDVVIVPLYLPMVLEHTGVEAEAIRMGGINLYLEHRLKWFRRVPRGMTRFLDNPALLRMSSRLGDMTDAHKLGAITLSMLLGDDGPIAKEVEDLALSLQDIGRPDVVLLSNVMLIGVARRLKQVLGCSVACTLQGEAPFLDALDPPFRAAAWQIVRDRIGDVDRLLPVSGSYGDLMAERLAVDATRMTAVWNGIEVDGLAPGPRQVGPPVIGFLSRMCRDKGLHTLIEAFALLVEREGIAEVRLRIAGVMLAEDRPLVDELLAQLERRGLRERVEVLPNLSRDAKIQFLRSLALLSVPATYGESFGLYVLEALACGVPVVQPRHGAFPEVLAATGGGVLCAPDDAADLARAMASMLRDREGARAMGAAGREQVLARFTADHMAMRVEDALRGL